MDEDKDVSTESQWVRKTLTTDSPVVHTSTPIRPFPFAKLKHEASPISITGQDKPYPNNSSTEQSESRGIKQESRPLLYNKDGSAMSAPSSPTFGNPRPVRLPITPKRYNGAKGADPADYLEHFERAAECNSWDGTMRLTQFPAYLTGYAASWYKAATAALERNLQQEWTWGTLRKAFLRSGTSSITRDDDEWKLLTRKQKPRESCLEYFFAMENMANKVNEDMPDQTRVKYIIRGLLPKFRKLVFMHNPNSTETLQTLLEKAEVTAKFEGSDEENDSEDEEVPSFHTMKDKRNIIHPPQSIEHPIKEDYNDLSKINARLDALERNRNNGFNGGNTTMPYRQRYEPGRQVRWNIPPRPTWQPTTMPPPPRPQLCYRCNKPGHFIRNCPVSDSSSGNERRWRPQRPGPPARNY